VSRKSSRVAVSEWKAAVGQAASGKNRGLVSQLVVNRVAAILCGGLGWLQASWTPRNLAECNVENCAASRDQRWAATPARAHCLFDRAWWDSSRYGKRVTWQGRVWDWSGHKKRKRKKQRALTHWRGTAQDMQKRVPVRGSLRQW